jgi:small redox-active disulfide protein 2
VIRIEVIGLDPPCKKCNELLANVKQAVEETGIDAEVSKKWTLSEEIRHAYGLLLSPALAIEGVVVFQGKVFKPDRIKDLLR